MYKPKPVLQWIAVAVLPEVEPLLLGGLLTLPWPSCAFRNAKCTPSL